MPDAPKRIWAFMPDIFDNMSVWQDLPSPAGDAAEYIRADLVTSWSDDMDAAPKDGTRVLTFHPANPNAIIERARQDNIVWNAMKAGQWWYSLPEQPPTRWMRVDPPFPAPSDVKG